jgi:hypothetical protein
MSSPLAGIGEFLSGSNQIVILAVGGGEVKADGVRGRRSKDNFTAEAQRTRSR